MYSEKLRVEILFSGLGFIRKDGDDLDRVARRDSCLSVIALRRKTRGRTPVWLKPKPTIARARSFHSFLSFVRSQRKFTSLNRSAGLQGVLGRCVNVRIMRDHRYTRDPPNVPFSRFKIRDRRVLRILHAYFFDRGKNTCVRFYRQD